MFSVDRPILDTHSGLQQPEVQPQQFLREIFGTGTSPSYKEASCSKAGYKRDEHLLRVLAGLLRVDEPIGGELPRHREHLFGRVQPVITFGNEAAHLQPLHLLWQPDRQLEAQYSC